jgi:hypothetical protein
MHKVKFIDVISHLWMGASKSDHEYPAPLIIYPLQKPALMPGLQIKSIILQWSLPTLQAACKPVATFLFLIMI